MCYNMLHFEQISGIHYDIYPSIIPGIEHIVCMSQHISKVDMH